MTYTTPAPAAMPRALAFIDAVAPAAPCSAGTRAEATNPAAAPPRVISSGMMKCSKSMNVATTNAENRAQ